MSPRDPRRVHVERYVHEVLLRELPAWAHFQQRCATVAQELVNGNNEPLFHEVDRFGFSSLDQIRTDATARAILDDWWLDNLVNGKKSQGCKMLTRLYQSLLRSLVGRRREQTNDERKAKKQESDRQAQRVTRHKQKAIYQTLVDARVPWQHVQQLAREDNHNTPQRNAARRRLAELRRKI